MAIKIYDFEVFSHDWIVVMKDFETKQYHIIHNNNELFRDLIDEEDIFPGFNSKHYDQHIAKAVWGGLTPEEIKQVNDYIIGGGLGWQCPYLDGIYFKFNNVDVRDDMQQGLSLKSIEAHLGLAIRETEIPFDLDRPLTARELKKVIEYCKYDVDTTEKLFELRKDYFQNKINIGKLAGLDEIKAMGMTNAKLTAALLKAKKKSYSDERQYVYPENLKKEYIPQEVFDFFNRMYDPTISDKEYFSSKLVIKIGDCEITLAFGGIHGAKPNYFFVQRVGVILVNKDVGSYYPHLCTINGYTSRNIPDPQIYEDVLETRMKAKASGDKATANALKLVCNTTYGAMLNQYNELYDPLMGRSVCISGQLYLLELAEHCYQAIESLEIVQVNTDGIMVELAEEDYPLFEEICKEWEQRTQFSLEEDRVVKLAQKDVNNYIEVQPNGSIKTKGGYLVKGISTVGAFNINNTACIVAKALQEYFVNDTPVEKTINDCNDIFQYQIVAKAGAKYKEAYHLIDDVPQPIQKVNRVYATTNTRYGKLYKVKEADDSEAKIESLPEHCIIDNENILTIADVDKQFYIDLAIKRINDFKGIKPEKKKGGKRKMATKTTSPMNVYQKLLEARIKFANAGVEKTGINTSPGYTYFELVDIVPQANIVFKEVGLLPVVTFPDNNALMHIFDTDKPEDFITFAIPFETIDQIISNSGKVVTNKVQAMGASVTYLRRYLYQIALDIVESDPIDGGMYDTPATPIAPKPHPPATAEQRTEAVETLTSVTENATELQLTGLKKVLGEFLEKHPESEAVLADLAMQTEGFTVISKEDCESLINQFTERLEAENG